MNNYFQYLLSLLPHAPPFRFVDEIVEVENDSITTRYTFPANAFYYEGHFPEMPVTPGVIVTETMVQGGLAVLAGHLLLEQGKDPAEFGHTILVESQCNYLKPVFPGETITIHAQKEYFRFGKIKCRIQAVNGNGDTVCSGIFSGMMVTTAKLQP
jgi:3-hydroxyacyl-[acyl-carrier-protein] dehydratase